MLRKIPNHPNVYVGPLIPAITGSNLLANPSFESGINGWSGNSATLAQSSSIFRGGSKSLQITVSASNGGASFTLPSQTSGQRIFFDIWVKGDANSNGKFVRAKIVNNGDASNQDTVKYQLLSTQWTRIRCSLYLTATGTVTISIFGINLSTGNIFYVDDGYVDFVTNPTTTCSNRKFFYNGVETFLRGTNYSNDPTGGLSNINFAHEEGMLPFDFADLQAQGCNMFRIYYDSYNANDYGRGLDCSWNYGLGVMVLKYMDLSFPYADPGNDGTANFTLATGTTNRTAHVNAIKAMVTSLKTHPAVIAWGDGSETNYKTGTNSLNDWFTLLDAACVGGKTIDSTRAYYTSNGGLPVPSQDSVYPNLDILGYTSYGSNVAQVYRGSGMTVSQAQIIANTNKTVMITEIGCGCYDGSPNGNQVGQAGTDVFLLKQCEIYYPNISGSTYFINEDNRNTENPSDNSWYGKAESVPQGAAQVRQKRVSYYSIKNYFTQKNLSYPKLKRRGANRLLNIPF